MKNLLSIFLCLMLCMCQVDTVFAQPGGVTQPHDHSSLARGGDTLRMQALNLVDDAGATLEISEGNGESGPSINFVNGDYDVYFDANGIIVDDNDQNLEAHLTNEFIRFWDRAVGALRSEMNTSGIVVTDETDQSILNNAGLVFLQSSGDLINLAHGSGPSLYMQGPDGQSIMGDGDLNISDGSGSAITLATGSGPDNYIDLSSSGDGATLSGGLLRLGGASITPYLQLRDWNAAADEGIWDVGVGNTGTFSIAARNDAESTTNSALYMQRTGTNVDRIGLQADEILVTDLTDSFLITPTWFDDGSFIASTVGCSGTELVVDVNWQKIGNVVTLEIDPPTTATCTSDDVQFIIDSSAVMPAQIQPSVITAHQTFGVLTNDGVDVLGFVRVNASGDILFMPGIGGAWVNTGTKGFAYAEPHTISYRVD